MDPNVGIVEVPDARLGNQFLAQIVSWPCSEGKDHVVADGDVLLFRFNL
ncbi:MAG: hypothetical protein MUO50_03285 [Longimicrobiales bacterium]|nr:hypothetical protein [Longimicrobiales bacterium]